MLGKSILASSEGKILIYHVSVPYVDVIHHDVKFNVEGPTISCTREMFTVVGILCCHCFLTLNVNCVDSILDKYILKRWTQDVILGRELDLRSISSLNELGVSASLWRT